MTKSEQELVLRELATRFPYGVMVNIDGSVGELKGIDGNTVSTNFGINYPIDKVVPYLRPMAKMTDAEIKEVEELCDMIQNADVYGNPFKRYGMEFIHEYKGRKLCDVMDVSPMDYYNKHMLDYRGLIYLGLALPATDYMYNEEKR